MFHMEQTIPDKLESNRNPDGTFKPGASGNPLGRPPGKTLKEYAREWFLNKTEEEKQSYIQAVEEKRPGFAWEMAEGKAKQDVDVRGEMVSKVVRIDE